MLSCGHPDECWHKDDDDCHCDWCEEVRQLKKSNTSLREQIDKQAITVQKDHMTLLCHAVGLLEIIGGSVNIEGFNPKPITNRTEKIEPDSDEAS